MNAQWADVAVLAFVSLAFAGLTSFKTAVVAAGEATQFIRRSRSRRRYFKRAALHIALAIALLVAAVVAFRFTGVAS
jgi:hypothetical protein